MSGEHEVTRLLGAINRGDRSAREALVPVVYSELRNLAESYMRRERPGHTLQSTALVNEAWMKLADQTRVEWRGRAHFFGIAAQAMRRILVDHHRRRTSSRRAGHRAVTLVDDAAGTFSDPLDFIALDGALNELEAMDPRAAQVIELRFFGGLSVEETAEVLDVSPPTVKRDWRAAKAWLYQRLNLGAGIGGQVHGGVDGRQ
jgi:RNA polymerase sigma factor (TIGR02999 family)